MTKHFREKKIINGMNHTLSVQTGEWIPEIKYENGLTWILDERSETMTYYALAAGKLKPSEITREMKDKIFRQADEASMKTKERLKKYGMTETEFSLIPPEEAHRYYKTEQGFWKEIQGRGSTGESSREIYNAAPELSNESSSGDVSKIERKRTSELSSDGNKSESARTDGDYNRAAERKQSGIPAGGGTGGLPKNGTSDGNIRKNSGGNDTKGDNLQRVNSSDIIGNTVYRYIKQKDIS